MVAAQVALRFLRKLLWGLRQRVLRLGDAPGRAGVVPVLYVCSAKMGPMYALGHHSALSGGGTYGEGGSGHSGSFAPDGQRKSLCVVAMDFLRSGQSLPSPQPCGYHGCRRVLVDEFFSKFGVPEELHSDQGREFESEVFRGCCPVARCAEDTYNSTPAAVRRMVERYNRTLAQQLAKSCQEGQGTGTRSFPYYSWHTGRQNMRPNPGFSPARPLCGRELRLPLDLITDGRRTGMPTVTTPYAAALK
ncbi:hypothetical protein GWK47_014447 [Chionoecetes opilio]|uniref:Integrase catalytic domain-containing protein n=1 Tax=Chionoecetes opilio TaxID=41210 RepID=A0A8J4Y053_CHIOP|nr:hypothetical protein GWK47_014447 [Chionoecetes opilio]